MLPIIGKILKWTILPAPSYPNIPIPDEMTGTVLMQNSDDLLAENQA